MNSLENPQILIGKDTIHSAELSGHLTNTNNSYSSEGNKQKVGKEEERVTVENEECINPVDPEDPETMKSCAPNPPVPGYHLLHRTNQRPGTPIPPPKRKTK